MKSSDLISAFIKQLLEQQGGNVELRRNELAQQFDVVPSQVSYVITSRFTPEHGYVTESHRGGGGYIRITKMCYDRRGKIMHIVNSIEDEMDANTANIFIKNMTQNDYMTENEAKMISAAISSKSLKHIPAENRAHARAEIFKNMLVSLL